MSNSYSLLARALANRSPRTLETQMPPSPVQGPQPVFTPHPQPTTVRATPPQLPQFEAPGSFSNQYMPLKPTPLMASAAAANPPRPQFAPQRAAQPLPQAQAQFSAPPISMEMQGQAPFAPQTPQGRNELERDYLRQFAENPNGFGTPDWLKRLFG